MYCNTSIWCICISLMASDAEYLPHAFLLLYILSSERFTHHIFHVFPNCVELNYLFFTIEFWGLLICSRYKYFIGYMICKFFSQSIICLCNLLIGCFAEQKFYIFWFLRSDLSNFSLIDYAFGIKSKTSSPSPEDVFLIIS